MGRVRLPSLPGPSDLLAALERTTDAVERLVAAVPQFAALPGVVDRLVTDVDGLLGRIEATRADAGEVALRAEATRAKADLLLDDAAASVTRVVTLLDSLEPSLTKLQPTIERLADTTDPREVDALVQLIDHLPLLAQQVEQDVLPVMRTLSSVAPDLHDLLDVSRQLNEMLAKLPGMGRIKKRVEEQQGDDD